jgi:diaminohydroxyphosphoribosylaminopyrimidine deaminase/5-amino-6-(5-phosphoribosylamino)uracil reductase
MTHCEASAVSQGEIERYMAEALALAAEAVGLSDPNPRVGCVITNAEGQVIGRGHTQEVGGPHAEIMAMRDAKARGRSVVGATVYVTLEPCAHFGRTPPCCDALIEAQVGRVIVALPDTNPQVAGEGVKRLRQAGIDVIALQPGPLRRQAHDLNIGFLSRMERARPFVRLKAAISLDGKSALQNGVSQWITGEAARSDGHLWRKRAGAILTGVGTVLGDDPRLDVRLVATPRQPLRVVVDSGFRTPPEARILQPPGEALIYTVQDIELRDAIRIQGVEVQKLPAVDGRVDLTAVLADLARRGVNELHVEAGHQLNGALVRQNLVDEYLFYVAPMLLGVGREMAAFGPLERLQDGVGLEFVSVTAVGSDLRIIARRRDR